MDLEKTHTLLMSQKAVYLNHMLIDTHTHLGHRSFDHTLEEVIARATAAGISHCIMPAVDLENSRKLLSLAAAHSQLHACVGIHPCDADSVPQQGPGADRSWIQQLRELACAPYVAALGEMGLDYYHPPVEGYSLADWRQQQSLVLQAQLDLAVELGFNVILHARDCHAELVQALRPYTGQLRAVFHCFTGSLEQAQEVIAMGHLVSFTGVVTFKKSETLQHTATHLPAGTFMVETDSPYLAPVPHRGKSCEPAFVADTARFIAALRGETLDQLATHTSATARQFFRGIPAE
jgi:TatD DNase family protein